MKPNFNNLLQRRERAHEVTRALVARGIVVKVELVVFLSSPPLASGRNLCDDTSLPPLLIGLFCHLARNLLLLGVVEVDGRTVLRASIGTLAVQRRGVVGLVEEF
jgi:hypothetical protein